MDLSLKEMKALILAAGYATRLYPLTKDCPKPLLKIGDQPIINYILNKLQMLDELNEIIVVTNSKFISLFRKWATTLHLKKRISLVEDLTKSHAHRRGAVGDMHFVINKRHLEDDLLVIGGDNLFEGSLEDFISFAKTHQPHPAIGAYDIKNKIKARQYGVIKLNSKKRVIDFQEKPQYPKSTLVAMCLYFFPKGSIGLIKEYTDNKKNRDKQDATGFYIDWLRKKRAVYGFIFGGCWYDIGHPQDYQQVLSQNKWK